MRNGVGLLSKGVEAGLGTNVPNRVGIPSTFVGGQNMDSVEEVTVYVSLGVTIRIRIGDNTRDGGVYV